MNNEQLKKIILDVFDKLEDNNFKTLGEEDKPIWEAPIFGIAKGDDEIFNFFKEHIGDFHWSPLEFFNLKYGKSEKKAEPKDLSVVSIIFPQTKETKEQQKKEHRFPSLNWVVSRGEWEPLIKTFSGRLIEELENMGIRAVSLDLQPEFSRHISKNLGNASNWSHRHAAYAAGMGTFGLSDGIITEKGKAVRITSLVVETPLQVTLRPYKSHTEYCLFFKDGSCGICMNRCPIGAITKNGHDKVACADYEDVAKSEFKTEGIDRDNYIFGCGLCQVDIPCQDRIPL